ncbi:uncharacterized protein LOC120648347 isoform X13 [Panicum virgatum]|uniref:uncharacterized protein LOC120648347 isoform X13 n=1 Tax=Panicum virgatum TaxID=38727 RepID=UPI0019D5AE8C|nr:uncharacterized protein LOC120648347 isoform X13 [Panicum virgatum]
MWCSDSKQTLKSRGAGAAGATMGNEESDNFSPTLHKDWSMGLLKLVTATVIFMGGGVPRWTTPSSTSTSATATKNLHQMSSLLEMLDDPDVPLLNVIFHENDPCLAFSVQRKAMESCIEILIVKLLHATKDAALKPSSDATWPAAAWSVGQARQRWRVTVGWSQLVARGRHDMVLGRARAPALPRAQAHR